MAIRDDILEALQDEVMPLLEDEVWPDTFVLTQRRRVDDDAGGWTSTDEPVAAGVCRLRTVGVPGAGAASERAIADRLGWQNTYAIDLSHGTQVTPADRITVNGRAFRIAGVVDTGEFAAMTTLIVQEVSSDQR